MAREKKTVHKIQMPDKTLIKSLYLCKKKDRNNKPKPQNSNTKDCKYARKDFIYQ